MNTADSFLILVNVAKQRLSLLKCGELIREYPASTAKNGLGEVNGSFKTPRGWHEIRARIGDGCPLDSVFIERRPTGEICTPELQQQYLQPKDWILTRILWLSGLEPGKNRLGIVDTMRRYIYIHGSPESRDLSVPGSRGCIRMYAEDIMELFELVPVGTRVFIS